MRGALKEPARTTALAREAVRYNRNVFVGGAPQGKRESHPFKTRKGFSRVGLLAAGRVGQA